MKLIYIDPVDKGYRNFLRINDEFLKLGIETLLLHTTSFFETIVEKEYEIGKLKLRDISYYNTKFIKNAIEIEKPSIIVMINLSFIFDRAIVNIAKKNNIKIVYLAHGTLINPDTYLSNSNNLNTSVKSNPLRIISYKNYLSLINYLDSQYKQNKVWAFFKLLKGIWKSPAQYLTFAKFEEELDVDLILVYVKDDAKHLIENMNFPKEKIKVVGNPEISEFMRNADLDRNVFLSEIGLDFKGKYILYLDDGLVDGEKIWTKRQWYRHLSKIANFLVKNNFTLVLKLHPRIIFSEHKEFFANQKNIFVVEDCDFKNLIAHSEFIISHYSSTILYGFLFQKNIVSPRWGDSANFDMKYDESLVYYCASFDDFRRLIEDGFPGDKKPAIDRFLYKNGIDLNIDSIQLVANEIIKIGTDVK